MRAQPGPLAPPPAWPEAQTPGPGSGLAEERRRLRRRFGKGDGTRDHPARGSPHSPVGSIASLASKTEATIWLSGAEMSSSSCAWRHAHWPGAKLAATSSGCYLKKRLRKAKVGGIYGGHLCVRVRSWGI